MILRQLHRMTSPTPASRPLSENLTCPALLVEATMNGVSPGAGSVRYVPNLVLDSESQKTMQTEVWGRVGSGVGGCKQNETRRIFLAGVFIVKLAACQ